MHECRVHSTVYGNFALRNVIFDVMGAKRPVLWCELDTGSGAKRPVTHSTVILHCAYRQALQVTVHAIL